MRKRLLSLATILVLSSTTVSAGTTNEQLTQDFSASTSSYASQNSNTSSLEIVTESVGFSFSSVAAGSSTVDGLSWFENTTKRHIKFKVTSQTASSGSPNANYYLYDDQTDVVIRGPVTVTGSGSSTTEYMFYDVPVGYYKMKVVNNGSGSLTSSGSLYW